MMTLNDTGLRWELNGMQAEIDRLRARNAELVAVLRSVEWGTNVWDYDDGGGCARPACPQCLAEWRDGHFADCALDAALRGGTDGE